MSLPQPTNLVQYVCHYVLGTYCLTQLTLNTLLDSIYISDMRIVKAMPIFEDELNNFDYFMGSFFLKENIKIELYFFLSINFAICDSSTPFLLNDAALSFLCLIMIFDILPICNDSLPSTFF